MVVARPSARRRGGGPARREPPCTVPPLPDRSRPRRPTRLHRLAWAVAAAGLLASCGGGDEPEDGLTLDQKVGQLVMMGVDGTSADAPGVQAALEQIRAGRLGGIVLYGYNITGPAQVRALNRALAEANPLPYPLLLAVDQEGGAVQRLRAANGFFDTPSPEEVAARQTPAQARRTWRRMAEAEADAGFDIDLAPVVDLRGDPRDPAGPPASPVIGGLGRAFSNDPATVVAYAAQFIGAHHDAGLLTALKHWPGHGLAAGDTHLGLVDVTGTAQAIERWPFQQLVQAGLADAVMTAHLLDREVDPDWPVTLSRRFIGPLLRGRDGFQGVVISDDLDMGAIRRRHDERETVVRALLAGNDILLFSNNPAAAPDMPDLRPRYDLGRHVAALVREAIARGELDEADVDAAWRRVARLRAGIAAAARPAVAAPAAPR